MREIVILVPSLWTGWTDGVANKCLVSPQLVSLNLHCKAIKYQHSWRIFFLQIRTFPVIHCSQPALLPTGGLSRSQVNCNCKQFGRFESLIVSISSDTASFPCVCACSQELQTGESRFGRIYLVSCARLRGATKWDLVPCESQHLFLQ